MLKKKLALTAAAIGDTDSCSRQSQFFLQHGASPFVMSYKIFVVVNQYP